MEDPAVKSVEADQLVALSPVSITGKTVPAAAQQIPWGITRRRRRYNNRPWH